MTTSPSTSSTPEQRAEWFRKWAAEHPTSTVKQGREALREHFGATMGTESLATILRNAKRAAGIGQPSPLHKLIGHNTIAERVISFVEDMRPFGITVTIAFTDDKYELSMSGTVRR